LGVRLFITTGTRLCRILFLTVKLDSQGLVPMNSSPSSLLTVRVATPGDARSLAVLSRQLLEYERSLNEAAGELTPWAASQQEIRKQILHPATRFFIAECNGPDGQREIVGYLKASLYGLLPARSEVGTRRWLQDVIERALRRAYHVLMRRPRPSVRLTGGYIAGAFVRPDVRRNGVGQTLIAAAEEWFRAHGAAASELHVLYANDAARRFWEEAGYEPLAMGMRKKL
jgi:GNAT superfamily N-acetyltransferase